MSEPAHTVTPDAKVFDAQAVQRLRELDPHGESRLLERVFEAFDASLRELLGQLLKAHEQGDGAAIGHAAHSLKSSCASVGALPLAAHAAKVEAMVRAGEAEPKDIELHELHREAERVLESLRVLLGPHGDH